MLTALADFYTTLTTPPDSWTTELRELVIAKKQPRKIFAQPNTFIAGDGTVTLKDYELSPAGIIQSFIERAI